MGLRVILITSAVLIGLSHSCIQLLDSWKQVSVEERARKAQVAFHGLAINTTPDSNRDTYSAQFWIINVYKGADTVASLLQIDPGSGGVFNVRDRRINVTQFGDDPQCPHLVQSQKYYIVFAERRNDELTAKYDDLFGATIDWTEENEDLVWTGVGWEQWSDWSACSASCGEGTQERHRLCRQAEGCQGYNKEKRRCNMFSCQGAVDTLSLDDRRYFHPSRARWEHVPGRLTAWRLQPNSYIWVPSSELFPSTEINRAGNFPREFTLFVTLRLHQESQAQGTVFSLRSRRQQDAYLSVELGGAESIKVVHAGPNGTHTVELPAPLGDGNWHQLALGFHDDSSVRSYMDCAWVSTDILKRNSLDIPEDADIIIGYLFVGDLEQLVIVPTPTAVGQQCSASKVPLLDSALLQLPPPSGSRPKERRGRRTKGRKGVEYRHDSQQQPASYQQDDVEGTLEGSGSDGSTVGDVEYEVEWSEWSSCSASCGTGSQSRYSRCVDDGSRLELCMEAGGERTETRACSHGTCPPNNHSSSDMNKTSHSTAKKTSRKHHKQAHKNNINKNINLNTSALTNSSEWIKGPPKPCACLNGGICHQKRRACHCPAGYFGRRCEKVSCHPPCQNGGWCEQVDKCICTPEYTGLHCESPVCDPPCQFGGECVKPYSCHCPPGTNGSYCQDCKYCPVSVNYRKCQCPPREQLIV